jgi:hypothetical protein
MGSVEHCPQLVAQRSSYVFSHAAIEASLTVPLLQRSLIDHERARDGLNIASKAGWAHCAPDSLRPEIKALE